MQSQPEDVGPAACDGSSKDKWLKDTSCHLQEVKGLKSLFSGLQDEKQLVVITAHPDWDWTVQTGWKNSDRALKGTVLHDPAAAMDQMPSVLVATQPESETAHEQRDSISAPRRFWPDWSAPTFPRIWDLAGYLFDHKTREKIYEPSIEELKEDYYEGRRSYRTKWARRWLRFCFALRTLLLVAGCLRNVAGAVILFLMLCWLPAPARDAVKRLLRLKIGNH